MAGRLLALGYLSSVVYLDRHRHSKGGCLTMAMHEPIALERIDWRVTKAACSCGAPLPLGNDSRSPKKQFEKMVAAFQKHKIESLAARQTRVSSEVITELPIA